MSILPQYIVFIFTLSQYDPTIEDYYQKTVDIDGKAIEIEILDTAGQDAYSGICFSSIWWKYSPFILLL